MDELKKIKVILVGESGVGKTCIIYRYIEDKFNEDTLSSISMSCAEKKIKLNDENKTEMLFEIWDTCGQEKYRHLSNLYFKEAKAAILVYDTTSKSSFNDIKNYWYNNVKEHSSKDISKSFLYFHI
jgi:small GTP-binding protein